MFKSKIITYKSGNSICWKKKIISVQLLWRYFLVPFAINNGKEIISSLNQKYFSLCDKSRQQLTKLYTYSLTGIKDIYKYNYCKLKSCGSGFSATVRKAWSILHLCKTQPDLIKTQDGTVVPWSETVTAFLLGETIHVSPEHPCTSLLCARNARPFSQSCACSKQPWGMR